MKRATDNNYYRRLWVTQVVLPSWKDDVERGIARMEKCMGMYKEVAKITKIPWGFFACTHWLEASCDPNRQILNGEPYNQVTRFEPTGYGPFKRWEDAAYLGINRMGVEPEDVDTLQKMLYELEKWNGLGYRNLGKHSPYLWSGTQHGIGVGKFVKDHVYDANAVSGQVGCAPLLHALIEKYQDD